MDWKIDRQVGRQVSTNPLRYSLVPSQYSKIKLAEWHYTKEQLEQVVALSKAAFEELGLGPEASEWADLEKRATRPSPVATPAPAKPPSPRTKPPSPLSPRAPLTASSPADSPRSPLQSKVHKLKDNRDRATSVPVRKAETKASALVRTVSKAAQSSLEVESRPKSTTIPVEVMPKPKAKPVKRRRNSRTPQFTSSEDESPSASGESSKRSRVRKQRTETAGSDPDRLRDRYEELYPAYQQLTQKLAAAHEAAERDQVYTPLAETERMVAKWEKWHAELSQIRLSFGEI